MKYFTKAVLNLLPRLSTDSDPSESPGLATMRRLRYATQRKVIVKSIGYIR